MANPNLPQEILVEIFSRLPAKTVGKCRTLSKHWKTHLSTNSFIKKHLITRQQTIQQQNVALTTQGRELCIITSPAKKDEVFNSNRGKWSCVLGSCNGLILLKGYLNDYLLLVNPITLKQVTIQSHLTKKERQDLSFDAVMYGFGYDSCADDYKIITLTTVPLSNNHDELDDTAVVDVYSVKNGVWKRVDGCYPYDGLVPSRYKYEGGAGGAFVNGALHWLICKRGFRSCIVAFDLAKEVFREIPLPYGFVREIGNEVLRVNSFRGHNMPRTYGVSVVGGCLVIVDNFGNGDTDVWIMKEYGVAESWVRFRIEAEDGWWDSIAAMLCYVEDGELLCLTSGDFLFACDLKGGTVRKVVLGDCDCWFSHGMAFVDSLVSPEGSL